MQQATDATPAVIAKPSQRSKVEVDMLEQNLPSMHDDDAVQTLSDADFKQLVLTMKSDEQDSTNSIITTLQSQLTMHQSRLDDSETEREELVKHNRILGKMTYIQNSRIKDLEAQVIALKLEVANEKSMVDHASLNVHQLTIRIDKLEKENEALKAMVSLDDNDNGEDAMIIGTTKSLISSGRGRGRRASLDLNSSGRTNCTETSTASEATETSGSILSRSFRAMHTSFRNLADSLNESGDESDSEHETKIERNLKKTTKGWASERVLRSKERKVGYYNRSFSG